ncbi:MAG: glycosyltransferase [Peptostreptococcaceae bacterium]|nr:glycosyltransferase [Peptostreptococcaceae bacterium]
MGKIMIITASTGGGHNQVAMTLEAGFEEHGHETNTVDFIKEENRMLEIIVEDGYEILAGWFPKFYGELYKITNRVNLDGPFVKLIIRAEKRRILEIIQEQKPDLIIGTHPFAVKLIGTLKKNSLIETPFISIVTDFEAHQAYIDQNVDAYVTGSRHTRAGLIIKGIEPEKIYTLGIPIKSNFLEKTNKPPSHPGAFTVLLMGGSMGLRGIKKVLSRLLAMDEAMFIYAVCGNNQELKNRLTEKHAQAIANGKLEVMGFVDNISELMDDADVIVTKPGGLTVSESIAKRLPMIIPFFIPGQEEENADFLALRGAAVKIEKEDDIADVVESMINDESVLKNMRENMDLMNRGDSIEGVIALAEDLLKRDEKKVGLKECLEKEINSLGIYNVWTAVKIEKGSSVMSRRLMDVCGIEYEAEFVEKVFIEDYYDDEEFKKDAGKRCKLR